MKGDEVKDLRKKFDDNLKKHAEVINTLRDNQKVLVNKISELEKKGEVNERVNKIINEVKTKTNEDSKNTSETKDTSSNKTDSKSTTDESKKESSTKEDDKDKTKQEDSKGE